MEAKEITISENTARLMQALNDMREAYFRAYFIIDSEGLADRTTEPWNALNDAFAHTAGELFCDTFFASEHKEI